jgi:hypothetical protein
VRYHLNTYSPTWAQWLIHRDGKQFNTVCFGRQSGKSTFGTYKLLEKAWIQRDGIYWYVGPTYRLCEQMHDRALFALKESIGTVKDKSYSDLMIQLRSGSRVFYKSSDNPDALLGETLNGAIMDETAKQKREIWTRYIMPMLGTTSGWCDFLSTPNGFDWFYDLYQSHITKPNWGAFHAPSTSNPLWTTEMVQEAKDSMSEDLFAQEIMAEFRDIGSGTCYVSFKVARNVVSSNPFAEPGMLYSPHLPIVVGMDFNLNPMSWVLGQQNKNHMHWEDELILPRTHTEEAATALVQKVMHHPSGLILIGDASGKAGQRAAHAGQSDYDVIKNVLRRNGITWQDRTPDANPGIKDRVNTANSALCSAGGEVRMTFNARMKTTIKDFQRRSWKQGATNLAFDNSDPEIGHASDAATYPVCVLMPIRQIGAVGRIHVISRSF